MKEMAMKNLLIFTTASGKTQLRGYVKIALGLFVILIALFGVNAYNRNQMVTEVMATPRPLDSGQLTTPTERVVEASPAIEECPSNPADWTLTENLTAPGSNLKGLLPQCVYDQLDRTASWLYATSVLGYSREDAADLFGFPNIPMEYNFESGAIRVVTDFNDMPQRVNLRFPSNNANLREWRVGAEGSPSVEFTFSGCFRTSFMQGGEVATWGEGYPVVCQYFADFQIRHLISDANGRILAINGHQNLRRPMWFGYKGNGNWVFLGDAPEWDIDLSQIRNRGTSSINPMAMIEKYGVKSHPLPEGWVASTGQEFVDAFLQELNDVK